MRIVFLILIITNQEKFPINKTKRDLFVHLLKILSEPI